MLATVLGVIILVAATTPQPVSQACSGGENREFDFWLGDWNVVDTATHKAAGHNLVTRIQGGCVLQEHWKGEQGDSGTSFNVYYVPDHAWHQIWVDSQGLLLQLSGHLVKHRMVLSGPRLTRGGKRVLDRIVWTPKIDGSVRQVWDASDDGGQTWHNVFDGTYVKSR